jgi:hypothetical protein
MCLSALRNPRRYFRRLRICQDVAGPYVAFDKWTRRNKPSGPCRQPRYPVLVVGLSINVILREP